MEALFEKIFFFCLLTEATTGKGKQVTAFQFTAFKIGLRQKKYKSSI